jgi:hypothetical protein
MRALVLCWITLFVLLCADSCSSSRSRSENNTKEMTTMIDFNAVPDNVKKLAIGCLLRSRTVIPMSEIPGERGAKAFASSIGLTEADYVAAIQWAGEYCKQHGDDAPSDARTLWQ